MDNQKRDGKPRCPKCGELGSETTSSWQFFGCGWCLDDQGREITPCRATKNKKPMIQEIRHKCF